MGIIMVILKSKGLTPMALVFGSSYGGPIAIIGLLGGLIGLIISYKRLLDLTTQSSALRWLLVPAIGVLLTMINFIPFGERGPVSFLMLLKPFVSLYATILFFALVFKKGNL
ncbi:MAG: hypothetical protein WC059_00005 [Candidatus Paceibacterota bacterium]